MSNPSDSLFSLDGIVEDDIVFGNETNLPIVPGSWNSVANMSNIIHVTEEDLDKRLPSRENHKLKQSPSRDRKFDKKREREESRRKGDGRHSSTERRRSRNTQRTRTDKVPIPPMSPPTSSTSPLQNQRPLRQASPDITPVDSMDDDDFGDLMTTQQLVEVLSPTSPVAELPIIGEEYDDEFSDGAINSAEDLDDTIEDSFLSPDIQREKLGPIPTEPVRVERVVSPGSDQDRRNVEVSIVKSTKAVQSDLLQISVATTQTTDTVDASSSRSLSPEKIPSMKTKFTQTVDQVERTLEQKPLNCDDKATYMSPPLVSTSPEQSLPHSSQNSHLYVTETNQTIDPKLAEAFATISKSLTAATTGSVPLFPSNAGDLTKHFSSHASYLALLQLQLQSLLLSSTRLGYGAVQPSAEVLPPGRMSSHDVQDDISNRIKSIREDCSSKSSVSNFVNVGRLGVRPTKTDRNLSDKSQDGPCYQYTTLESTQRFICQNKPKVLTFEEAKKITQTQMGILKH